MRSFSARRINEFRVPGAEGKSRFADVRRSSTSSSLGDEASSTASSSSVPHACQVIGGNCSRSVGASGGETTMNVPGPLHQVAKSDTEDDYSHDLRDMESSDLLVSDLVERKTMKNAAQVLLRVERKEKDSFIGCDAVDALVMSGCAQSREEAIHIGRTLALRYSLFEPVSKDSILLEDGPFVYRINESIVDEMFGDSSWMPSKFKSPLHHDEDDEDKKKPPSDGEKTSLLEVANVLQQVNVKDRRYKLVTYKACFVGSDAVDMLVSSGCASSREEAVQLGRAAARRYKLFEHVCREHELKDELLFYRFKEEPSSQLALEWARGPQQKEMGSVSNERLLEAAKVLATVEQKDRRRHLLVYKNCFVGKDAVDLLVESSLCTTREEAVHLGRKVAYRFEMFEHVCQEHPLQDDHLFYRMKKESPRLSLGCLDSANNSVMSGTLIDIVNVIVTVERKDRRHNLIVYKNCFVGSDAVDLLVSSGCARSRQEAVDIGRKVAHRYDLFEHVCREHALEDSYLFYRFKEDEPSACALSMEDAYLWFRYQKGGASKSSLHSLAPDDADEDESGQSSMSEVDGRILRGLGNLLLRNMTVTDRTYRLRTYKNCFVGSEAVNVLVYKGLAKTRRHAVRLCRMLERELGLFEHVCREHPFQDGHYFYRFKKLTLEE